MPGKYNYEQLPKYPHLLGEDVPIWDKFIQVFPVFFDSVDYDIKIGSGVNADVIDDTKYKTFYEDLTKKRIDVIGYLNEFITIVEIKKRVSLSTLGQILGYKFLYSKEHPDLKLIKTLIITSTIDRDDLSVLEHFHIPHIIVTL